MAGVIIGSLALASGTAKILAAFLVSAGVNFFSGQESASIPSFSVQLGADKTFDLLYIGLFLGLAMLIFGMNTLADSNRKGRNGPWSLAYVILGLMFFLQTHFVRFSGSQAMVFALAVQAIYLTGVKSGWGRLKFADWIVTANGLLAGFYAMLIVRMFTTSLLWVAGAVVSGWAVYQICNRKFKLKFTASPAHILLAAGAVIPWNSRLLVILGGITAISVAKIQKYPRFIKNNLGTIYSFTAWILAAYDPLFYWGNLDSVEEGFWLGWLQRLLSGQVLYRDAAVYHPPFLIWGLWAWTKITGASLYFVRMYFQVLRLIGLAIIFGTGKYLLKSRINLILYGAVVLAMVSNLVRNNVEIRVGTGLLAIYLISEKKYFWSGVVCALALGISPETGVAAVVACGANLVMAGRANIGRWLGGAGMVWGVTGGILSIQKALVPAIGQIGNYARAFSAGYFNVPVERPELQNILMWWRVDRFFASTGGMWELAMWGLGLTGIYAIYRYMNKSFVQYDRYVLLISIYAFILTRAALGRSDWYHLLFLLLAILPSVVYAVETWEREKLIGRGATAAFWIILILVFNRDLTMQKFVNSMVFKIESYANISQDYLQYKTDRSGIALDIDAPAADTNELIDFLQVNTGPEDRIFSYPWNPEIYFLANRNNATKFDTPYAFFSEKYQSQMIRELEDNQPKYVIYNGNKNFAGLEVGSLPRVNEYLSANYSEVSRFGSETVMTKEYNK